MANSIKFSGFLLSGTGPATSSVSILGNYPLHSSLLQTMGSETVRPPIPHRGAFMASLAGQVGPDKLTGPGSQGRSAGVVLGGWLRWYHRLDQESWSKLDQETKESLLQQAYSSLRSATAPGPRPLSWTMVQEGPIQERPVPEREPEPVPEPAKVASKAQGKG